MEKNIEKIILGFMFIVVLYNLFYYDVTEGFSKKWKRKRKMLAKKRKMLAKKRKMARRRKRKNPRSSGIDPKIKKQINTNKNKINTNKNKINTNKHNNSKLSKLFYTGQKFVSKNNDKINKLISFSKLQGDKLQGNIDLISSDLAKNNIENLNKFNNITNKLSSINNNMITYEKNNDRLEKMLKSVNVELQSKYQNKK